MCHGFTAGVDCTFDQNTRSVEGIAELQFDIYLICIAQGKEAYLTDAMRLMRQTR